MSDDFTAVMERARTHATVSIADCATLIGRSRNRTYQDIRTTGEVCGIGIIRAGASGKSLRVPSRPLLRLLGLLDDDSEGTDREV